MLVSAQKIAIMLRYKKGLTFLAGAKKDSGSLVM
jgi:hypothetical protein